MSWIRIISYSEATGKLKKLYDRIKGPDNYIDNIMLVHSLRPNTLEGHMSLYKNTLHHANNTLAKWLLEAVGGYVSALNGCTYCVAHHFRGMTRCLHDDQRAADIREALTNDQPEEVFSGRELAIMQYAKALTCTPHKVSEGQIEALREQGLTDGEILEINQVVAYFAYANRTVLGLGVDTTKEIIGLSPGNDEAEDDWHHR